MDSPPKNMQTSTIIVKKNSSIKSVAYQLQNQNLITYRYFFSYLAVLKNVNIIKGKYRFYKGTTASKILEILSTGDVLTKKVTIPEGFNLYEIAETLEVNNITKANEFLLYSFDQNFIKSLGINSSSLEGYIFPDTYIFTENSDTKDIIKTMHKKLNQVLESIDLKNLNKLKLDKNKLLILASIVEKEAQRASERQQISAVFHNRLNNGMRLDSDPTIRYAVKKFKGRIRYKDLKFDSPFNTRKYKGLTPTPICSVGRDSIIAALNPADSSYLYFVARNDGSHYFSKTLREHYKAVDYYQKKLKNGFIDKQQLF
jgi:UPF0755 protein